MELEGRKELVDTGKSSRTWSVPTDSLRLAVLNVSQGFFGPKMAVFRPKMADFGPKLQFLKLRSATCESRSRPPPLSFLLTPCMIVLHTHRYHPPKFHPNLKHHDGVLIFPHLARAACCWLLAAAAAAAVKPGRSTLDTKKGYKTNTGSASSVNLNPNPNPNPPPPHPIRRPPTPGQTPPLTPGQTPPLTPARPPPTPGLTPPDPRLDPPQLSPPPPSFDR